MKSFSSLDRANNINRLKSEKFDLLIVGGGITGAGVARDAAMRGMKVGLVEGRDFAEGTSSRSSKLIHGGIRYLENFEFHLVFEALSERHKLFEIAPHLVHPLRFMIPIYKDSRVGMFKMGLGMWAYEVLSMFQAPEWHEKLNAKESLRRMPILQSKNLSGSYVYSDAYMDDDRLVHETLRSANEFGAVSVNFTRAVGFTASSDLVKDGYKRVKVQDLLGQESFDIECRHVVSSVGPWTDELGGMLKKDWKKILRPTKGVHLTFARNRFPLSSAVVMGAEKRIVFAIPRHEMVIVGTTDTDFKGKPEDVAVTREDVEYLLGVTQAYFPEAHIQEKDILSSYAGVRPLVADDSENEGKTSREHTIFSDPLGITFVAGGKYTTYRLMAEQIVKEVLRHLPFEERIRIPKSSTATPLNPLVTLDHQSDLPALRDAFVREGRLSTEEAQLLVDRHGLEARVIVDKYSKSYDYWQLEAAHAIENTMCLSLKDFCRRRVPLFLADPQHGLAQLSAISRVFQDLLNLSAADLTEQQRELKQEIETELAWRLQLSSN